MPAFARELNALHCRHIMDRKHSVTQLETEADTPWEAHLKNSLKRFVVEDKRKFGLIILESDVKHPDPNRELELEDFCAEVQAKVRWLAYNVGQVTLVPPIRGDFEPGLKYGFFNPELKSHPEIAYIAAGTVVETADELDICVCQPHEDPFNESHDEDEDEEDDVEDPEVLADLLAGAHEFTMLSDMMQVRVPTPQTTAVEEGGASFPDEEEVDLVNLSDQSDPRSE